MASYTPERSTTQTTTAATVDTITFTEAGASFEISNWATGTSASDVLWVRFDGTAPTVAGDDCIPVFWGQTLSRVHSGRRAQVVKVIATNAVKYTIERLR